VDLASLPIEVLEERRRLRWRIMRFRWKPAYSPAALEALVAALPVDGEVRAEVYANHEAWRGLRRTAVGYEVKIGRHGSADDEWTSLPMAQALAWIAGVADTKHIRQEGCLLVVPAT
jgi:hypothetical protein